MLKYGDLMGVTPWVEEHVRKETVEIIRKGGCYFEKITGFDAGKPYARIRLSTGGILCVGYYEAERMHEAAEVPNE